MTDEQLVLEYRRTRDERYFEALMDRHVRKVRGMTYSMVLNDHDADDLTQEIFIKAARNIAGFRGKAKFSTWLHRVTMNTVYDHLRRRRRRPVDACGKLPEQGCPQPRPDALAAGHEGARAIAAALRRLPAKLRAAITLTAIHGLAPGEAAAAEKCLPATMYWRIHEARRRLKADLKELIS